MGDIINWTSFEGASKILTDGTSALSGKTIAEATELFKGSSESGIYTSNVINTPSSTNIIEFPNATASEAVVEFLGEGGTTTSSGALVTEIAGASSETLNTTIVETGTGTLGLAGIMTMTAPAVAVALAPLAGIAIGYGIYASNPELMTEISNYLLGYSTFGNNAIPSVFDSEGNTYYSEDLIKAMQNYVSEKGWGDTSTVENINYIAPAYDGINFKYVETTYFRIRQNVGSATPQNDGVEYEFNKPVRVSLVSLDGAGQQARVVFSCNESFIYRSRNIRRGDTGYSAWTKDYNSAIYIPYDGAEIVYYTGWFGAMSAVDTLMDIRPSLDVTRVPSYIGDISGKVAYILQYGNSTSAEFPDNITKWGGTPYDYTQSEPVNVFVGYDDRGFPLYNPYYPVTTPAKTGEGEEEEEEPWTTVNPAIVPVPNINPNPAPAIEPYINPIPSPDNYPLPQELPLPQTTPQPNPVPVPENIPDPTVDPSQEPSKPTGEVETPPKEPISDGNTPIAGLPIIPTLPSEATALLHVYNPTQGQIDSFGAWLWNTFSGDIVETISKLFNNPMDAVIGLHELYATPTVTGTSTIKAGFLDSEISSRVVGNRYSSIDCGTVIIPEYYQNYLDYSPYTKCFIYLPFIGIKEVSADDIIGNSVQIVYKVDSYTGCCIAVITVARKGYTATVYQFEGNCAVEIPITSGYQSTLVGALLGTTVSLATGSVGLGAMAGNLGRANLSKNEVQHSGSFGSCFGAMGIKIPYIIVKRPVEKEVYNYSESYGYPAHKSVTIGSCSGYLRVEEVEVLSTTATNDEKDMIVSKLKEGIYV